ncbi:hypothetical protein THF5G08_40456 [Vibrio jasicida]|nr:hypothetical protein THF5G08_40456 [Vibrio jasicida]
MFKVLNNFDLASQDLSPYENASAKSLATDAFSLSTSKKSPRHSHASGFLFSE